MKNLLVVLLLFPILSHAQSDSKLTGQNSSIGISLGFEGFSGVIGALYFTQRISKNNALKMIAKTNFEDYKYASLGWRRSLLKYKFLEFGSGMDIAYSERKSYERRSYPNKDVILSLPLYLNIDLNNRLSLNLEYGIGLTYLSSNSIKRYRHLPHSALLGVSYKF